MAEQNQLAPELVVLSKKLSQAQAEYDSLRTSMVQQVSNFRKLVKAIFDLDDGYFGGRFQSQEAASGAQTPQQDLAMALRVVDAISDELQGASAFVDSPLLRDQVANLVAAVDSLRDTAIEADRTATNAIGFTGAAAAPATFPARTFPENNPLACLTEAVGFLRDLQGLVSKLKDRIGALVLMAQEADEARNEAEAATAKTIESRSVDKIAGSLSAELAARDAELSALRTSALKDQETHAEEIRRIRTEIRTRIDAAQEAVAREGELHSSDVAEARSLAAEIERLAAADPESSKSDDLDITLGVLRDSLKDEDGGLAPVTAAAESVLTTWSRIIGDRAASAAKELSTLRWQLGESASKTESLQAEVVRLTAEAKRLAESEKGFTTAREAVSKELSTLRTQVAEQSRELHGRELALKSRDEAVARAQEQAARTAEELARERASRDEDRERNRAALTAAQSATSEAAGQFETVIQRARGAAENAEKQLGEVRGQLGSVRAEAEAARAETAKVQAELARVQDSVAQAQARERQATEARERAERTAQDLRAKSDAGSSESTHLRGEIDRLHGELAKAGKTVDEAASREQAAIAARGEAERSRTDLSQKLDRALHQVQLAEAQVAGSQARMEELEREVAALSAVRDRLSRTEASAAESQAKLAHAEQAAATAAAEATRLAAEVKRLAAESQSKERKATEADQERSRTAGSLAERESRIAELAASLDKTRAELVEAQARASSTAGELARLKTIHEGAVQARDQSATELAVKLKSEAAASAERDTARAALTTAYAERDRLQGQVERQRVDLEAQTRVLHAREQELGAKLADTARQAGESKQVADTLKAENDRLRAEVEKSESRSATDIKKVERRATETQRMVENLEHALAEARAKVTELTNELATSEAAQQNLLERAETEAMLGEGNAKRWTAERAELIELVKHAKTAVQNAKVARESDIQRIAELAGEITILKTLKPAT